MLLGVRHICSNVPTRRATPLPCRQAFCTAAGTQLHSIITAAMLESASHGAGNTAGLCALLGRISAWRKLSWLVTAASSITCRPSSLLKAAW